jgi:DNA (cytosine-5)-methyltransferase 1
MNPIMKTVELFAGIGGFRIAADGLELKTVWSNDICPKANLVYIDQFGSNGVVLGDFQDHKNSIPDHDILTGGFPCQPFSSAGKKEGVRDPRGTLFQHIVDVLYAKRPKYFALENVKRLLTMERGCHFATILGALADLEYRLEWRLLNAMDFGLPQNRERVVILGERSAGKSRKSESNIKLAVPTDFSTVAERWRNRLLDSAGWRRITDHRDRFPNWGMATDGRFIGADLDRFDAALPRVRLSSILEPRVSDDFDFTETTLQWIHKNTPVNRYVHSVEILSNQKGGARMGYTIFGTNGVAPTLTSTASRHYERYKIGDRYRRLTNVEYARIQGFPDDHCRAVSVYDQYALFGNAVPPPLARWALSRLIEGGVPASRLILRPEPATLFDHVR